MRSVRSAIDNNFAYVSEDRKTYGLVLIDSITFNMSLWVSIHFASTTFCWLPPEREPTGCSIGPQKKRRIIMGTKMMEKTAASAGKKANLSMKQYGMMLALIAVYVIFAFITEGKNLS